MRGIYNEDIGNLKLTNVPEECPYCHFKTTVHEIANYFNHKNQLLQVVFVCFNCQNLIIGYYEPKFKSVSGSYDVFSFKNTNLGNVKTTTFPDCIEKLSPKFVEIYHQAELAEYYNLSEICGGGYRKAIEFLVKDYAIKMCPDKVEAIKIENLSPCINEYFDNGRIKAHLIRAVWLGNDETHYERIWKQKDIEDLKLFIKVAINDIESNLLYEESGIEMNKINNKKQLDEKPAVETSNN